MKIEKLVITKEPAEVEISEVTLLSEVEFEQCQDNIPPVDRWWWMRSPGNYQFYAAIVYNDGSLKIISVNYVSISVRPALRISNLKSSNLLIKDRFEFAGHTWTVISDELALCDDFIGSSCFRADWQANDANDYAKSDVKQFVDKWARENVLEY